MTFYPEDRLIIAERALTKARALTVECPHCAAEIGQECFSRTGVILVHQPAHFRRLQEVGA